MAIWASAWPQVQPRRGRYKPARRCGASNSTGSSAARGGAEQRCELAHWKRERN